MATYLAAQLLIVLGVRRTAVAATARRPMLSPGVYRVDGMQTRQLGPFTVSAIGLGAMPMSMNNDKVYPEESQAIATIHAALDAGITLIDTADIYAPSWDTMGHNEVLVGKAMRLLGGNRDDIVIATKGGITRSEGEKWGRDGSMTYLRSAVEKSLRNLGVDVIDLYQWHRPDRSMVYAEAIANFKTLRDEGKIKADRHLQRQRGGDPDRRATCSARAGWPACRTSSRRSSGAARTSWSSAASTASPSCRGARWAAPAAARREVGDRFAAFGEIAAEHGVSPQQVVLAWELSLGEHVIPIPGARRPESITDSAKAADLMLSDEELARCSASRREPVSAAGRCDHRRRRPQRAGRRGVPGSGGAPRDGAGGAGHARRGGRQCGRRSRAWTPGCPGSPTWSRCCRSRSSPTSDWSSSCGRGGCGPTRPVGDERPAGRRRVGRSDQTALRPERLESFAAVVEPTLTEPLPRAGRAARPGRSRVCGRRWSSDRSAS